MKRNEDTNRIQHPEVWELLVSIAGKQADYILYTPKVANSLMTGDMVWNTDTLQSMEDAVYDTPLLLNEYKRVRVVVHSPHFVLFPDETDDENCITLLRQAFPADDGDAAVCPLPLNGVKIAYLMPQGLQAFLGRTFSYPTLYHHLFPWCEYLKELSHADDVSQMFLNLGKERMDLAVYRAGRLQCVNSYMFDNQQDALFFILKTWRSYGMDQLTDELLLMGDREMCAAVTPKLRKFVKFVMPAVYPAAAMRLGRHAMQAPLELILLALCE